jgi:lipoprotein-releasing system ATP-binding protein
MSNVLTLQNVKKQYRQGDKQNFQVLEILSDITLALSKGVVVGLIGVSGSGKSTLLHLAGLLDDPTEGAITLFDQNCTQLSDAQKTQMRAQHLGFVYQHHYLLAEFTALENVILPQWIAHKSREEANQRAADLLNKVGLNHRVQHCPGQLSGGEKQRVAIARALANNPGLLLADEPTGNLDERTAHQVFDVFLDLVKTQNLSALIATHDMALTERMDHVYLLTEGRLVQEK